MFLHQGGGSLGAVGRRRCIVAVEDVGRHGRGIVAMGPAMADQGITTFTSSSAAVRSAPCCLLAQLQCPSCLPAPQSSLLPRDSVGKRGITEDIAPSNGH